MNSDFWHTRWAKGEIGFHQEMINPHLKLFWHELGLKSGDPVFVPLCGKSRDMRWLSEQGHPVTGVELSPVGVQAFFDDHGIRAERREKGRHAIWESGALKIFCGDFFHLTQEDMAGIKGVYDRASLIALPPDMRDRYAEHFKEISGHGVNVLLVTLEYPEQEMKGPPFAVDEREVRRLFEPEFEVSLLCSENALDENLSLKKRGLSSLKVSVYLLLGKSD